MKRTILEIYETLKWSYDPANIESFKLLVNAEEYVWDYKVQNGELRFIHENVATIPEGEQVSLGEVMENCSEGLELPIVSESTGLPFVDVQLVEVHSGSEDKELMLNFVTGTVK